MSLLPAGVEENPLSSSDVAHPQFGGMALSLHKEAEMLLLQASHVLKSWQPTLACA